MTQNKSQNNSKVTSDKGQCKCSLAQGFFGSEHGATAIEYALIAGGLSIVILASVQLLGVNINTLFVSVQSAF